MRNNLLIGSRLRWASSALCVLFISAVCLGQSSSTDGTTPSYLTPGAPQGSYALSQFDNVNLFNGNLNFHLPLLGVGGRGGAKTHAMLTIEQHWRTENYFTENGYYWISYPNYNWWSGIKPGYGPGVLVGRTATLRMTECYNSGQYVPYPDTIVSRLTFTTPDGTEYELHDTLNEGRPMTQPYCSGTGVSRGTTFVTWDGTAATFISDTVIRDNVYGQGEEYALFYPSGYLLLRDGTRYRIDNGHVSWLRDRNGNKLTFGYDNNGGNYRQYDRVVTITDSLNRQVTINYNVQDVAPYGLCDKITFSGFGGAARTIRVSHTSMSNALRSGFSINNQVQLFPELNGSCSSCPFNPTVTSAVWLPDGRAYKFFYNNYGELARVELPTGGVYEYDYAAGISNGPASGVHLPYSQGSPEDQEIYRRVVERRVYTSNGVLQARLTFSRPESFNGSGNLQTTGFVTQDVYHASGALASRSKSYFVSFASFNMSEATGFSAWNHGKEYKTEHMAADGSTILKREEKVTQQRANHWWWTGWASQVTIAPYSGQSYEPALDPRLVTTTTTLEPNGANLVARQTVISPVDGSVAYDAFNNQTDSWEYDYGPGTPGAFLRRAHTGYVTATSYTAAAGGAHLRNLVAQQWVSSDPGGGNLVSRTDYAYDQSALTYRAGITGHDPAFSTGYTTRGNPTTVTRYANAAAGTGAVTTTATYDIAGNVVSATDAKGKTSYVGFTDNFSDGVPRNTYALPTSTTSPVPDPTAQFGSSTPLTTATAYDYSTGRVTAATDANGKTTSLDYTDPLDRLKVVTFPDGGSKSYTYDRASNVGVMSDYVRTLTALDASRSIDSYQFYDGLGRLSRTFLNEGGSPAVFITTDTQYDAMGRAWRVSNPYRTNGSGDAINPAGHWTTTGYDGINRVASVTTAEGAVVSTAYSGNQATVTDQAGKKRRSVSDALGRVRQVIEDPSPGANHVTTYDYDAAGNLRRINQGGQFRFYMYDSLSRLVRAKNPEQAPNAGLALPDNYTPPGGSPNSQWSAGYSYDNNGNLAARTDARGVTVNYGYDPLNRNTTVRYTDSVLGANNHTKDVDRHYDGAVNGRGRLYYFNWDASNNTRFDTHLAIDEYDAMGRTKKYRQHFLTNGAASPQFTVTRAYDKAGNVISQTYPSGRTVGYSYDVAGRLNGFSGNLGDGVQRTYSTAVTYSEFGGIKQEQFGTQTPLYHKLHYNVRGQLYDIRLSTASLQADEWNWNRGAIVNYFSSNYQWGASGADNNGNLRLQQHWVPLNDQVSDYSYTHDLYDYDALNRISSVREHHGTPAGHSGQDWAQYYDYDRWGNMTVNLAQTYGVPERDFDKAALASSNQLYAPGDTPLPMYQRRMQYDGGGFLVFDNYTGTGSRAYDAEGRIVSTQDMSGGAVAYTYDADGRRIKRTAYGATVWQLHGPGGELLAEYNSGAAPFAPTKEYGYRRGELLVTAASGDPDRVRRFVKNLYYNALARDPSPTELQTQTDALAQAGAQGGEPQLLTTARSIARGLFQSSEYIARNRTDAQYVTDLYNSYLQRGPDTPGLNYWVSNTQANGRGATLNAFEVSTEFATLAATVYGTASGGENQRVETFVRNFYYGALQRDPTAAELQTQRQRLNNAGAVSQSQTVSEARAMGAEIFQSTNYNSGRTDQQYVTDLYVSFLQRQPDGPGLNYWVSNTQANGRAATLEAFKVSGEYAALAGTLYREVFWLVSDQIGTPRMAVARTGSLAGIRRHDYLPFGEELIAGVGWRGTAQGYGLSDNIRQKFTAQERDAETGLDYFKARYYASALGRFTSTDPVIMSKDRAFNPQEINLYAYCKNSPLGHIDPDGKFFVGTDGKKVDVSVDKSGKLALGNNASADLKRMAGLVSQSGSATAMSQFMKVASNDTSVHFKIEGYNNQRPLYGLHQAHDAQGKALDWDDNANKFKGDAEFLTQGKKGDAVGYKEATITLYEDEIKDGLQNDLQQRYGDPRVTVEDALVSVFSHEVDHDTNVEAIQAIQDNQEGNPNNTDVESPADAVERQVIAEILKNKPSPY